MLNPIKERAFFQLVKLVYFLAFLGISYLIFEISPTLTYVCKKKFLYSNYELLKLDILILSLVFIIWKAVIRCGLKSTESYCLRGVLIGSIALFAIQVYISYNIYFLTGWDAGGCIIPAAKAIASGLSVNKFNTYFSTYPNNITLVWIFSLILKLCSKFGITNSGSLLMPIIVVNCFISSLSGFLTFKCVEKLINMKWAVLAWIVYFLLVGTSPWIVITYSDSFALFLPILIFFIYLKEFKEKYILMKWGLLGTISFIGYSIKPQVIIIFISICLIEIWRFFFVSSEYKKKKSIVLTALVLSFLLSNTICKIIYRQTGFSIDKEKKLGMMHFVMMGMNDEGGGYYNAEDVRYSLSFADSAERRRGNVKVIEERIENFGARGYMKFLMRKTLVNYGDGTFAWSMEGGFYKELYPDRNERISPLLKSYYYIDGRNYGKTSTFQQAVWIGIIVAMLGLINTRKYQLNNKITVLMLSILGLTAFQLLFEARARYLYIYTPIYICLSVLGLKNITDILRILLDKIINIIVKMEKQILNLRNYRMQLHRRKTYR
jgi:hypothetical protein